MAATHIRIRIGASLDASVDAAFDSVRKKAQRAGQAVARELGKGMAAGGRAPAGNQLDRQARDAARAQARALRQMEAEQRRHNRMMARDADQANREATRSDLRRIREAEKAERQLTQTKAQEARKRTQQARQETRNAERAARAQARFNARMLDRFATRTTHRASRFFWPNAPVTQTAKRVGMDILRGAGVETNLAGLVGNVRESDTIARSVAIQAYQPGEKGAAGTRVDPETLKRESLGVAKNFGIARTEVLGGLKSFVDMRGNLQGARDLMGDMAKLAKSQSADFTEVMHTAAKIDSALASQKEYANDTEKTYKTIRSIMMGVVYQGKIGSVTIEQMAKQIPKLSGIAAQFGGDAGRNLLLLTTATQLAERGPAKNPATAATYVQSLALDLPKRAGVIEKMTGRSIFDASGKMRGLDKIIEEMMWATKDARKGKDRATGRVIEKTQVQQLQEMLPNKRSFLALQEFLNVFQGAGGGKAGIAAIRTEFKHNTGSLTTGQMNEDLAIQMASTASKAERFNARLEEMTERMLSKAIPALEQLEEPAMKVAGALADLFTWAAKNPFDAIFVALAGATVRAAIESTFRASIEAAIYRGTGAIVTASGPATKSLEAVGSQAGFAAGGLAKVAAQTAIVLIALYSLKEAAEQAAKLWKELHRITPQDLGKGEDPESAVGKARSKARDPLMKAASKIEDRATSPLWGATSFGPGAAPGLAAAQLRIAGQVAGMEAANKAVGEGLSSSVTPYFNVNKTAASTEDVMDKLAQKNWEIAAAKEERAQAGTGKDLSAKLDGIKQQLASGIRITNPEDFKPPAGGGTGVDNDARDVQ